MSAATKPAEGTVETIDAETFADDIRSSLEPRPAALPQVIPAPAAMDSPLAILAAAVQRGATVDELKELTALADRIRQEQARVALDDALAEFQAVLRPIPRNREAVVQKDGRELYRYKYADLAQINKSIKPALKRAGLAVSYDARFEGNLVTATATVRKNGAAASASFSAFVNNQISLNEAQKTGGALTYAKRQALMAVLGIDGGDHDDDGATSGARVAPAARGPVSEAQAAALRNLCEEVGTSHAFFLRMAKVDAFEDVPAARFDELVGQLERKRRAR